MNKLRASVDDPDPNQGRRLVAHPPIPRTRSELRVAAELRTGDDELMIARLHKAHVATVWAHAIGVPAFRRRVGRGMHAPSLRRPRFDCWRGRSTAGPFH